MVRRCDGGQLYFDAATSTIGIEPLSEGESGSYSLTRSNGSGGIAAKGFLNRFDLIPEKTTSYVAEWDDEHEMVVVPVSKDRD